MIRPIIVLIVLALTIGLIACQPATAAPTANLAPSARGEYEISDLNRVYLEAGLLQVSILPRGTAWFDTGTFQGLLDASQFVHVVEARPGYKIGCVEEIAWHNGWIDDTSLAVLADRLTKSGYGVYLKALLAEKNGS